MQSSCRKRGGEGGSGCIFLIEIYKIGLSLNCNFLCYLDWNWLTGKVFKVLKNALKNEISDLVIMIIGLQLFVLLIDSKTNSNQKE